jgi:hypothetical protein
MGQPWAGLILCIKRCTQVFYAPLVKVVHLVLTLPQKTNTAEGIVRHGVASEGILLAVMQV